VTAVAGRRTPNIIWTESIDVQYTHGSEWITSQIQNTFKNVTICFQTLKLIGFTITISLVPQLTIVTQIWRPTFCHLLLEEAQWFLSIPLLTFFLHPLPAFSSAFGVIPPNLFSKYWVFLWEYGTLQTWADEKSVDPCSYEAIQMRKVWRNVP